jgi:two-component system sensor histidine kinase HydH
MAERDPSLADTLEPNRERQAVADKRVLLERLMARLAHEIRNPLSSLDVHVQLLEEDIASISKEIPERLSSRFEIIRGELHRLESIVGHFLKLAGPSELDIESLDIGKVVSHVCDLLRPEAAERGIQITLAHPENLPVISGDRVRLTQALLNVVINAIQALGQDGDVKVDLSLHGGDLHLSVSDNGPGIAPEKMDSIFDPYFTTKEEGSGLGLWIAQQIVTAHRGTLRACNNQPSGAQFIMSLPLQPVEKP